VTESPKISILSESLDGQITLRSFNKQGEFTKKFLKAQDENLKNAFLSQAL